MFNNKKQNVAFRKLIRPYMNHINQLAFRLTGNKHDSEDLIQEVLLKVYPLTNTLTQGKELKSWLGRVLYNTYVDQWRKHKNNPIYAISDTNKYEQNDESFFNEHICNSMCPEQLTSLSQQQQTLTRLLFKLTNEHRIVIIMHDVEGYTLPELSEILDVTLGTLKSRLHRARNNLKILLAKENICQPEVVA